MSTVRVKDCESMSVRFVYCTRFFAGWTRYFSSLHASVCLLPASSPSALLIFRLRCASFCPEVHIFITCAVRLFRMLPASLFGVIAVAAVTRFSISTNCNLEFLRSSVSCGSLALYYLTHSAKRLIIFACVQCMQRIS